MSDDAASAPDHYQITPADSPVGMWDVRHDYLGWIAFAESRERACDLAWRHMAAHTTPVITAEAIHRAIERIRNAPERAPMAVHPAVVRSARRTLTREEFNGYLPGIPYDPPTS